MRRFILSLCVALLSAMSASATDYYVKVDGTGAGTSWEDAMNFATFKTTVEASTGGDTFYFAEGTYYVTDYATIKVQCNLVGSLSATTGEEGDRTIFDGTNATDAGGRLLSICNGANVVEIKGIDFTNSTANSNSDNMGAIQASASKKLVIRSCNFYGNIAKCSGKGGQALLNSSSDIYLYDCNFYDNKGVSHGVIRMRAQSTTDPNLRLIRCAVYNNSVTNATGSAICVQHGAGLYLVNSTICNNTAGSGPAIFVNGKNSSHNNALYVINSTIAGNECQYQAQVGQNKDGANLHVVNSIIVGNSDDGSSNYAINLAGTGSSNYSVTYDDYSYIGSVKSGVSDYTKSNTANVYSAIFGSNTIVDGGITPATYVQGSPLSALATAKSEWGLSDDIDLTTDYAGTARTCLTTVGAIAMPLTIGETGYATFCSKTPLDFTDYESEVKAYVATKAEPGTVYLTKISKVPASTGIVLNALGGGNTLTVNAKEIESAEYTGTNLLKGTLVASIVEASKDGAYHYFLAKSGSDAMFLNLASDQQLAPHKAYLETSSDVKPATGGAKIIFEDGATTAITSVNVDADADDAYYSLSGVRVSKPQKGIYIHNGKKIIVK